VIVLVILLVPIAIGVFLLAMERLESELLGTTTPSARGDLGPLHERPVPPPPMPAMRTSGGGSAALDEAAVDAQQGRPLFRGQARIRPDGLLGAAGGRRGGGL
jgi:hypothetical protein